MTISIPILHFNDVYRVKQSSKSLGGTITADQFAAKISSIRTSWGEESRALDFLNQQKEAKEDENDHGGQEQSVPQHPLKGLVLFSGDVFNPSLESSVTRGAHMVDVLNACSIDAACVGNHDFDFGYPHLKSLMKQTNFPWTFTNIADVGDADAKYLDEPQDGDKQVEGTLRYWICEVQGIRIGCIGLVEKDWIATVPAFPPTFRYRSMVSVAKKVSKELRDANGEHRCDLVIAITHCRLPNDIDLANDLGARKDASNDEHGVDLVLGGHDHTYYIGKGVDEYKGDDWHTDMAGIEKDKDCMIVKSGTDFHDLSEIALEIGDAQEGAVRKRRIVGAKVQRHSTKPSDPTLPELKKHIDELMERVDNATGQPVCFSLTPLDCRMDAVRTKESAAGDLIADILLYSYGDALRDRERQGELSEKRPEGMREVDMTLICGGSLRGDDVFGPGAISLRDILTILPFEDAVVVIELKGQDIWDALEGGFGSYPNQEGRFPQVGGLSIVWDSRKPPGKRLVEVHLLEDAHLFDSNGLKRDDDGELPKKSSIAFEPSEEGGYSIDVRRPNICKGEKLQMDKIYRVCTREYMADGHDGYDALSRGTALIDHESGALMSTQVRKFLLGASLIWRLKSFQENSDENGKGVVGQNLLSLKTKEAIKRAQALHQDSPNEEGSKENGTSSLNAKITPRKGKKPAPLSGFDKSPRVVIDSSPGGIRDAMHVGASENHSQYDPASRMFKGGTRAPPNTASSLQFSSESPGASPTRGSSYLKRPSVLSPGPSPLQQENGEATPSIISKHFQLGPEDAEVLRHSNGDLAVIAPLIDGRIVDLARLD